MKILKVPVSSVVPWDKNPRGILGEDLDRLKRQIVHLGVYKPLVCCKEGKKYIVLGGNMRILALQDLGAQEVEISVVKAETEAKRLEYALSDNDRAGYYEREQLAELILPHIKDISLADYKVDLGGPVDLQVLIEKFGPDLEPKEKDFDESLETQHECPKCGYKW
jgi:hypothetical protein